jgi:acetyl-CoA acetyltransferase
VLYTDIALPLGAGWSQGPTGLRSVGELIGTLRLRGGGLGLFAGCAAGDTGVAIVSEVTD